MIEINEALSQIYKSLYEFTSSNGMEFIYDKDTMISRELPVKIENGVYSMSIMGEKGSAMVIYDAESKKIRLLGSGDAEISNPDDAKELSVWILDTNEQDDRDVKSIANDFIETMESNFASAKLKDISQVKLPKSVSKNKAKSGAEMYDVQTLANKFVMLYPEYKDDLKQNIFDYGELLPIDFCEKFIVPKTLEVLESSNVKEQKKLFGMYNDIYEDGLNEVQDIIAVVILSNMNNNPKYLEIADKYMSDYMKPTIHRVNEMMEGEKGDKIREKIKNPPPYKPRKEKKSLMSSLMGGQQQGLINR